jgi:Uma2 family endonuclease
MEMLLELEPPYLIIKPDLSEEDFYRLAGEDSDWEYIDGRVVMHSPASDPHEDLFRFLITLFSYYLDKKGGAQVRGSRYPMRLDPRWSPEPELLVVRNDRKRLITKNRLEGPADLAVEIVSDADAHLVYWEKLPRYREAGIQEIWIVDPFEREVLVDRTTVVRRKSRTIESGRLDSSTVPGFWIDVGWLWRDPLPSTAACLDEILLETGKK